MARAKFATGGVKRPRRTRASAVVRGRARAPRRGRLRRRRGRPRHRRGRPAGFGPRTGLGTARGSGRRSGSEKGGRACPGRGPGPGRSRRWRAEIGPGPATRGRDTATPSAFAGLSCKALKSQSATARLLIAPRGVEVSRHAGARIQAARRVKSQGLLEVGLRGLVTVPLLLRRMPWSASIDRVQGLARRRPRMVVGQRPVMVALLGPDPAPEAEVLLCCRDWTGGPVSTSGRARPASPRKREGQRALAAEAGCSPGPDRSARSKSATAPSRSPEVLA